MSEQKRTEPYHMTLRGTNGYTSVIEAASHLGTLSVTVTRTSDQKSWRGERQTVEDAIDLMAKIISDQTLIAQMREGDRKGEPA